MADENNPQGIASLTEQQEAYKAALEYEKAGTLAQLKSADRYSDDAKAKVCKGVLLDIDEELAKFEGASEDDAAAPKRAAKAAAGA